MQTLVAFDPEFCDLIKQYINENNVPENFDFDNPFLNLTAAELEEKLAKEEQQFSDLSNPKTENEGIALQSNKYICDNCQHEGFEKLIDYVNHLRTHDEENLYNCHLCDFGKAKTLSIIKSHLITHHKISKSLLTSTRKNSKKEKSVVKEIKERKFGSPISLCEICSQVFDDETALNQHLESHHSFMYTCDICGEKLKLTIDFINHLQVHSEDKLYRCTICEFTSKLICKMRGHLQAKHDKFRKYKCDICEMRFHVLTHYMQHRFFHNGEKPFVCEICNKSFMYSRYKNSHIKQEHETGNFECQYCQEVFTTRGDRSNHVKKHRKKSYPCDICGKVLSGSDKLKNHYRIHTGDKPYNCNFCPKSFTNTTRLSEHENIHKEVKPYECNQCGKRFTQPTSLKNHLRKHSGERPFKCLDCGKEFVVKSALNVHKIRCKFKK